MECGMVTEPTVLKDAERYRWLRAQTNLELLNTLMI